MWKNQAKVAIYNSSRWHISAHISNNPDAPSWFFTRFYGHPETTKSSSWEFLKSRKLVDLTPWLCCGDFNEITSQDVKMGGPPRPYKQMERFRDALECCSLNLVMTLGSKYTWANNRSGQNFTREQLDKALANPAWL
ncbi:hypothetical protein CIPAW_06G177100 [Carya illinoinensis]|uniref:Endonuclease/exonuclease/phosphatase domain-containing protein n=1 Tax=Carya illinoinensis TaxID=32201 RepID=A0A8T1QCP7_CARIL|nr:hypothetical protein CIPAW_06G177100 [Carya illinoinensis]